MCLTSFPSSLKNDFDWEQYADDLSQCVEAMIESAITQQNLNDAYQIEIQIAEKEKYLMRAFREDLDDGSNLDGVIDKIDGYVTDSREMAHVTTGVHADSYVSRPGQKQR